MRKLKKATAKILLLAICCVSIVFGSTMSTSAYSMCNNQMILGPCAIDLAYYSLWNTQNQLYTLNGEIVSGANELVSILPRIDYCLYSEGTSGSYTGGYYTTATGHGMDYGRDTNSIYLPDDPRIVRKSDIITTTGRIYYEADYYYPSQGRQSGLLRTWDWNFG